MGLMGAFSNGFVDTYLLSKEMQACEPKKMLTLRKRQSSALPFIDETFVDVDLPSEHKQIVDENEAELNFSLIDTDILRARIITPLPKRHESTFGAQVVFTCLTTVLFPVTVDWLLNGNIIEPTIDGRIYFTENRRQLVIMYVTAEETGIIEVVARNKFGHEKSRCRLSLSDSSSYAEST